MKNLGKIILFLILTVPNILSASVKATVDAQSVSVGEEVTLNLNINGEDIQKPSITQLCGYDVISSSSQTSIQMVNLDYQKTYILSYKFVPQKSCTIEPIEIVIDSKVQKTEPIKIEVKPYAQDLNADFQLLLSTEKKDVYVGEPFELTLLFKQKRSVEAVDSKFIAPELKGFWAKGESQPIRYNEGEFTVTKLIYKLAAQRAGILDITPAQMRIASRAHIRDSWGSFIPNVRWKSYFSNDLNISAKPLPNGVTLVGDFSIDAIVDKTEVNVNEAVNITIEVTGDGNLEDIKSFKPYVNGVSVFDEKIQINGVKLTQKIAFVGDSDFTIPSFSLKYFDLKSKEVKTLTTKAIKIKVNGSKPKQELVVKKENPSVVEAKEEVLVTSQSISPFYATLIFFAGLLVGIALMLFNPLKFSKKEKSISLKDPKTLLIKLMPYEGDPRVKGIMDTLERNIYENANEKIDKKLLKECLKQYNII